MGYKVLYRKYRPDNFDNLVGQEAIVKMLKNSIINDKISHAYLFSGPRGTGKTSTARILAKTINCLDNKNGIPCEKCANCQNFNTSPDIIEIDAASNNGVDEIRELINNVKLMPASSKYKVYIIDEVHMLSQSAFNALLLTLEEPPKHVIFILATTNIENVPITILSRCQKYEFKKISDDLIIKHLKEICKKENIKYQDEGIEEIAMLSDGGMRDALSIVDQLSKENKEITIDLVTKNIGTVSTKSIKSLIDYLENSEVDKIIEILKNLANANINYKITIKKLVSYLADKCLDVLKNGEKNISYNDLKNLILELNDCINKININVNPYIIIQTILLSYVKTDDKLEEKTKEIKENIEKESTKDSLEKPKETVKDFDNFDLKEFINNRINNCFVNASKKYLEEQKELWNNYINQESDKNIKGLIIDTVVVAASDEYAIITCNIDHLTDEINNNINEIELKYNETNKSNYKFVFISENEWKRQKKEYINKIKNGEKYTLIKEKLEKKEKNNVDNLEMVANDLFDKDKLVIK